MSENATNTHELLTGIIEIIEQGGSKKFLLFLLEELSRGKGKREARVKLSQALTTDRRNKKKKVGWMKLKTPIIRKCQEPD